MSRETFLFLKNPVNASICFLKSESPSSNEESPPLAAPKIKLYIKTPMIVEIIVKEVSKSVTGTIFDPTPVVTITEKNNEFKYFEKKLADGDSNSGGMPQGRTLSPS